MEEDALESDNLTLVRADKAPLGRTRGRRVFALKHGRLHHDAERALAKLADGLVSLLEWTAAGVGPYGRRDDGADRGRRRRRFAPIAAVERLAQRE